MKRFTLLIWLILIFSFFSPSLVLAIPRQIDPTPDTYHGNYWDPIFPEGSSSAYDTVYGSGTCFDKPAGDNGKAFRCYAWQDRSGNINGLLENNFTLLKDTSLCNGVDPNWPSGTLICGRPAECGVGADVNSKDWGCYRTDFSGFIMDVTHECKDFFCPYFENYKCCKPVEPADTNDTPIKKIVDTKNTSAFPSLKEAKIKINPGDCCNQIVPPIDHTKEKYTINHLVQMAINIYECILCIVAALILLMIVVGGFVLLTSAGSSDRVATGKRIIIGAVVGGIIVIASYLIIYAVVMALGGGFDDSNKLKINPGAYIEKQDKKLG